MADARADLIEIVNVEVRLDHVQITHGNPWPFQVVPLCYAVSFLTLAFCASVFASLPVLPFVPAFGLTIVWAFVTAALDARIVLRPGQLSLELALGGLIVNRRIIAIQTIREVEVIRDLQPGVTAEFCLLLHLSSGDSVPILPFFHSGDAAVVGLWLRELVERQATSELAENSVPDELQRLRRGRDRVDER